MKSEIFLPIQLNPVVPPYLKNSTFSDKKCEGGQVWNDCGMDCLLTCDGFRPAICSKKCKPRCQCPTTAPVWHEDAGKCVTNDLCPAKGLDAHSWLNHILLNSDHGEIFNSVSSCLLYSFVFLLF